MNSKEVLRRIKAVLNIQPYSFAVYTETESGVEFKCEGDELVVGEALYVVTPEGELPAPNGEFVFEDGYKVKVEDGLVKEIEILPIEETEEEVSVEASEEEEMESEEKEEEMESEEEAVSEEESKFVEANLVDGIMVQQDGEEFEIGKELYVVTEEGKSLAPDGEHETEDGKILVVVEGKITEIKEKEEVQVEETPEVNPAMEEMLKNFSEAMEIIARKVDMMDEKFSSLESKYNQFANMPAGNKVYDNKNIREEMASVKKDRLAALSSIRRNK